MKTVAVIGLGYVGLPLAVAFARAGLSVIGIDVDGDRVKAINEGHCPIDDVDIGAFRDAVASGELKATTAYHTIRGADAAIICVPTPLTQAKQPDLTFVEDAVAKVGRYMAQGSLVVLESTVYPGTTRDVVWPLLERSSKGGLLLAYSPERVDPANKKWMVGNTPKLMAGLQPEAEEEAMTLYALIAEEVERVVSVEVAELAKVFENVFRSVNIGLVNELALFCEHLGTSVWDVLNATETKPFGYMRFNPGPGVGGHCIPLDPYYLLQKAATMDHPLPLTRLGLETNEAMPYHVARRVCEELPRPLKDASVLVLGVTYKPNVADTRESPALKIMELLEERVGVVDYHDPYVPELPNGKKSVSLNVLLWADRLRPDWVVLTTPHSYFNVRQIVADAPFVFDACGATHGIDANNVVRLGE